MSPSLILALGVCANVGVLSVVYTLVLQPRSGRIDSLVGVFNRSRTRPDDYHNFSYPAYREVRERRDIFESLLARSFTTLGIRDGDLTRQAFGAVVSSNCFEAPVGRCDLRLVRTPLLASQRRSSNC